MDRTKIIAVLTALLALQSCSGSGSGHVLRVGSKNFTEQVLLGEIIAQHLEHRLHQKVDRSLNLGGTLLAHQALLSGGIDLYPEYSGTALAAVLKQPIATDPAAVLASVRAGYQQRFQVAWLDPLGINNTFAMVIRGDEARAKHLETLSDAARPPNKWVLGMGYEFQQRADGMVALDSTYHPAYAGAHKTMDLGLLYNALEHRQVTMIAANATDGLLSKMDLKVLRDDRHAFPPYQLCILVRDQSLNAVPGLKGALLELSGKLTDHSMQELNYEVDGRHRPIAEVAASFLMQAGLR